MNLNKYHRQAFVKAVMNDVPMIDYDSRLDKIVLEDMIASAPKEIAAVLKIEALRHHVLNQSSAVYFGGHCCLAYRGYKPSLKANEKIAIVKTARAMQEEQRAAMRDKLVTAIGSVRTVKQATALMPELAKHLPVDATSEGTKNLPAVANLLKDLVELGWPNGGVTA